MTKYVFNEAMKIRREALIIMSKLLEKNSLHNEIAKLPKVILSKDKRTYRESVYHEREVLSQRLKVYLGLDYSKTKDLELFELMNEMEYILQGKSVFLSKDKYLNIIDDACDVCMPKSYYITDGCRKCVAKPCINVCPKRAISMVDGRMKIDNEKCVNCGLCAKVCNYNAIIVQERPCESACSLGVIKADTVVPEIDQNECVNCGKCYKECPFGAIETPSRLFQMQYALNHGKKIRAIFAPSIAGQFGMKVNSEQIKEALKKVGFLDAVSAAIGADEVAASEAEIIKESNKLVTTSCCPAFVKCIEKFYPDYSKNISHELSPMLFLAKKIKEQYPNDKIAFIGPCIAKKSEADNSDLIDYVITFEELGALFIAKKIEPSQLEGERNLGTDFGWNFAQSGGVSSAVQNFVDKELKILKMNGLEESKKSFMLLKQKKYDMLEGMACNGGCVGGPGIMINPSVAKSKLKTPKK